MSEMTSDISREYSYISFTFSIEMEYFICLCRPCDSFMDLVYFAKKEELLFYLATY